MESVWPQAAWPLGGVQTDDETLAAIAAKGDDDALDELLGRYRTFVRQKAKAYYLLGADHDDIVQEGMIGLFKAIRDFDPTRNVCFRAFADLCVTRQVLTAIKTASRLKHQPLNSSVSIHRPMSLDDESDRELVDFLVSARVVDPVDEVVAKDEVDQIRYYLATILSEFEADVLSMYLQGSSYVDIASLVGRPSKSVDNALQRVKRKLESWLRDRDAESDQREQTHPIELHDRRQLRADLRFAIAAVKADQAHPR